MSETKVCPECGEHCFEQLRTARLEYLVCFYTSGSSDAYSVDQEYKVVDEENAEHFVCRDCGFEFDDPAMLVSREEFDAADD